MSPTVTRRIKRAVRRGRWRPPPSLLISRPTRCAYGGEGSRAPYTVISGLVLSSPATAVAVAVECASQRHHHQPPRTHQSFTPSPATTLIPSRKNIATSAVQCPSKNRSPRVTHSVTSKEKKIPEFTGYWPTPAQRVRRWPTGWLLSLSN